MAATNQPEKSTIKQQEQSFRCDFCGAETPTVRRVALDQDYDRLRTPHKVQFACPDCSEEKERRRQGEVSSNS